MVGEWPPHIVRWGRDKSGGGAPAWKMWGEEENNEKENVEISIFIFNMTSNRTD